MLGGVDNTGNHLHCIYPHGSTDALPYTTMGSGSLAAMAVLEASWKSDLSVKLFICHLYFVVDFINVFRVTSYVNVFIK